ncbi:alpha/beta hydrolase family protein [Fodinicola acaciae]|uniref:alpha/beta hydrolase family protein n=1 Tax=Fodinicola acaciae TaxID=2681555 RepID=UPI0013D6984F|nr:alpha/beta fold hydrolase [Fodinicola acaciae]
MKPLLFEDDAQFWFETLRVFGHAAYGGADFGEVVTTASRITAGDYDSWHDAWLATADRLAAEARRSRPVTARELNMRASTYYRCAEFFLHGNPADPRIANAYDRSVECFRSATDESVQPVEIPYEDTVLRGYFYRAPGTESKPLLVMHNGFDGAAEEMHFFGAAAAAERGCHALTFDGPGQPSAIHRGGLVFRPDWENVVGPVLDFAVAQPGVDPDRIALLGLSLGGMLAPRAAAYEPRLAAVIAVDGVYDAAAAITSMLPFSREELLRRTRADSDPDLDAIFTRARSQNPTIRWAMDHGRYVVGAGSDREFVAKYLDYHLRDGVAERISCPALVCAAADDLFFAGDEKTKGQPELLYEHLTGPKTMMSFTAEEGADAHCHVGAQRLAAGRIYDWLEATLAS